MPVLIFLKKPLKGRSPRKVYSRALSTSKAIVDALGIEVVRVEVAKLSVVRLSDVDKEVINPDVFEVPLDKRFRPMRRLDLSGYSTKYMDGYVDFLGKYKGEKVLVHLGFVAGVPRSVRRKWGDIAFDLHGDLLTEVMKGSEIERKLRGLEIVKEWRFE